MASTSALQLDIRAKSGSSSARQARAKGAIPGVLYGHGQPPLSIAVDGKAVGEILHGRKQNILDITLEGKTDTAIIRDMQLDPVTRRVVSIDFQRVSRSEVITSEVAVVTTGVPIGVKDQGGVLDVVRHEVEISGPADKTPDEIRVDVTSLNVGEHISAGKLPLPDGFKMVTPADTTIVAVEASKTEAQGAADLAQATPEGAEAPAAAATPAP